MPYDFGQTLKRQAEDNYFRTKREVIIYVPNGGSVNPMATDLYAKGVISDTTFVRHVNNAYSTIPPPEPLVPPVLPTTSPVLPVDLSTPSLQIEGLRGIVWENPLGIDSEQWPRFRNRTLPFDRPVLQVEAPSEDSPVDTQIRRVRRGTGERKMKSKLAQSGTGKRETKFTEGGREFTLVSFDGIERKAS